MLSATPVGVVGDPQGDHCDARERDGASAASVARGSLHAPLAIGVAAVLFVCDVILPRGALPAIGYALVPVLVGGVGKRSAVFWLTAGCTVLTWLGLALEPASAEPPWMSAFNRLMITGVLWLSSLLVARRLALAAALAERTEAVERTSEELARSNAELDRFASRVAHDLRGPLHGVGLVAQLLSRTAGDVLDAEAMEWVTRIEGEVRHMGQLVQRLLVYGRAGSGALRPSPCDAGAVLRDVVRSLDSTLEPAGATITHDVLPELSGDPVLVAELFQNLIENAVKYRADRPPRVHVSAARVGEEVVFSVRDNGIGIAERDQATIFRPFTQLHHASGGGLGLGLATCKRIVERHGGRIWVESAAGEGATFRFALPATPSGASKP